MPICIYMLAHPALLSRTSHKIGMKAISYYFHELMENITALGSIFVHLALAAAAYALGDELFVTLLKGLLLIYVVNVPLKLLLFRERPRRMQHRTLWERFEAASFPSVHAVRVVFLALALGFRFGNPLFWLLVLGIAVAVTYSRIHLQKHYWTDTAAGIAIGAVIYYAVASL